MTTTHIMIDLETWGKAPGCDLRSIGACVFDPMTGVFDTYGGITNDQHFYIATDNPLTGTYSPDHHTQAELDSIDGPHRRYNLTRDPSTVQWWNDQSAEAQAAFTDPVDLRDALGDFSAWLIKIMEGSISAIWPNPHLRLWSHGPAFDPPILAAAYAAVGLPVPWHYRAPRDTRTLFDVAGIDDHSAFMTAYNTGTAHHALDDAIAQAKSVCGAYERLTNKALMREAAVGAPVPDPLSHIPNTYRQGYLARDRGKGRGHNPYGPMTDNNRLWNEGWRAQEAGKPVHHDWPVEAEQTILLNGNDYNASELALIEQGMVDQAKAARLQRKGLPVEERAKGAAGDQVEAAAQGIYEHWKFGQWQDGAKPEWIAGGNSNMQELARDWARSALSATNAGQDYETAWRELHGHLAWMQHCSALPTKYLGRNFGDIANRLIADAYPDLAPFINK